MRMALITMSVATSQGVSVLLVVTFSCFILAASTKVPDNCRFNAVKTLPPSVLTRGLPYGYSPKVTLRQCQETCGYKCLGIGYLPDEDMVKCIHYRRDWAVALYYGRIVTKLNEKYKGKVSFMVKNCDEKAQDSAARTQRPKSKQDVSPDSLKASREVTTTSASERKLNGQEKKGEKERTDGMRDKKQGLLRQDDERKERKSNNTGTEAPPMMTSTPPGKLLLRHEDKHKERKSNITGMTSTPPETTASPPETKPRQERKTRVPLTTTPKATVMPRVSGEQREKTNGKRDLKKSKNHENKAGVSKGKLGNGRSERVVGKKQSRETKGERVTEKKQQGRNTTPTPVGTSANESVERKSRVLGKKRFRGNITGTRPHSPDKRPRPESKTKVQEKIEQKPRKQDVKQRVSGEKKKRRVVTESKARVDTVRAPGRKSTNKSVEGSSESPEQKPLRGRISGTKANTPEKKPSRKSKARFTENISKNKKRVKPRVPEEQKRPLVTKGKARGDTARAPRKTSTNERVERKSRVLGKKPKKTRAEARKGRKTSRPRKQRKETPIKKRKPPVYFPSSLNGCRYFKTNVTEARLKSYTTVIGAGRLARNEGQCRRACDMNPRCHYASMYGGRCYLVANVMKKEEYFKKICSNDKTTCRMSEKIPKAELYKNYQSYVVIRTSRLQFRQCLGMCRVTQQCHAVKYSILARRITCYFMTISPTYGRTCSVLRGERCQVKLLPAPFRHLTKPRVQRLPHQSTMNQAMRSCIQRCNLSQYCAQVRVVPKIQSRGGRQWYDFSRCLMFLDSYTMRRKCTGGKCDLVRINSWKTRIPRIHYKKTTTFEVDSLKQTEALCRKNIHNCLGFDIQAQATVTIYYDLDFKKKACASSDSDCSMIPIQKGSMFFKVPGRSKVYRESLKDCEKHCLPVISHEHLWQCIAIGFVESEGYCRFFVRYLPLFVSRQRRRRRRVSTWRTKLVDTTPHYEVKKYERICTGDHCKVVPAGVTKQMTVDVDIPFTGLLQGPTNGDACLKRCQQDCAAVYMVKPVGLQGKPPQCYKGDDPVMFAKQCQRRTHRVTSGKRTARLF